MRYSTITSAVLLAATTAPALAYPVTTRATEDASIVERELQDALVERGYYDDLVSRDLEARGGGPSKSDKAHAASIARMRKEHQDRMRQNPGFIRDPPSAIWTASREGTPLQHPRPYRPAQKAEFLPKKPREYDFNGELFERGFEIDELD
ncbi:uncharacterized protein B0H18DRAFT_957985 [Fomitopsis serialis]|uniref:uncharacterized protein n=1 Tax=Fomitopsis serialis TaxID=139415 RepID=UPI0020076261|nr:uncharacterized protein B0H18DRAFT_957985 [Neoantrodia serialis]KAH9918331.1 hypothetical protein B0H18DRAFT_957985 [Neoantrodia serialis]